MSDTGNAANNLPPPPPGPAPQLPPPHPPYPFGRLLAAIAYGFVAWFVLHILFVLAAVQFVVFAINGKFNEELKGFCLSLLQYEWELLAYMTFVRDEQPFPLGPFPKHA